LARGIRLAAPRHLVLHRAEPLVWLVIAEVGRARDARPVGGPADRALPASGPLGLGGGSGGSLSVESAGLRVGSQPGRPRASVLPVGREVRSIHLA
jgi:hypothetical protein